MKEHNDKRRQPTQAIQFATPAALYFPIFHRQSRSQERFNA